MLDFAPSQKSSRFAFNKADRVTINEVEYRPIDTRDEGYVFVRLDGTGVAEPFGRREMARLVELGQVKHERDALLPESARVRLESPSDILSTLPPDQLWRARLKEALVLSFRDLYASGLVKRTEESITENMKAIRSGAIEYLAKESRYDAYGSQKSLIKALKISAKTLRRWTSAYDDLGLAGLFDNQSKRGNRNPHLDIEQREILAMCVRGYMTLQRKSQAAIYEDVKRAFRKENENRGSEKELKCPSKETVRLAIKSLDPYQCDVARHGVAYARRRHAPVGTGLMLTRPLQRVELDTWKVDVISLMSDSGLLHFLEPEDRERLGLDDEKKRWQLTVAMCATTRCILGMKLSETPSAQATTNTIDMMTQDKGQWSDAVGALSPWHMRGTPEWIVTDCGNEYVSFDARVSARDLGIRMEHCPGGHPEMRGRIERLFKTMSINLTERLTGRTFGNIIERGDYASKSRAALTVDDLCAALIRWVVDIYHRLPHDGLDGEQPIECWDRLTEIYGVAPTPDLPRRRIAFGTRMKCNVQKDGITVLGVRYHSEVLARKILHRRNREVDLSWYSEDIGAIAVEIDGEWIEVPSVFSRHRGVRAHTWLKTRRDLQSRFKAQAKFSEEIVHKTIDDIEAINEDAMRRVGIVMEDWSEERIKKESDRLFIDFQCEKDATTGVVRHDEFEFGDELPTNGAVAHENFSKTALNLEDRVSAPSSPDADPVRSERDPSQGDDPDEPDFDFEDK